MPESGLSFRVQCVACNADGSECEQCGGGGLVRVEGCPHLFVTPDVGDAFLAAQLADKGLWPVSGGWMEQAAMCVDAVQFIWSEQAAANAAQ